jgi:hypothetical protein
MAQAKTNTSTILDPSRRGFLAQAAGVAAGGAALGMALPLPVSAGDSERVPDPILAAIERHRRAYRDWMDGMGEDEIEAAVPAERRQSSIVDALYGDPDWQVAGDDPRWIAHIETACRVSTENEDAAIALISFDTLSLAGAVALLAYAVSVEAKDPQAWPEDLRLIDGKRRTWHFFLIDGLSKVLRGLMPVTT